MRKSNYIVLLLSAVLASCGTQVTTTYGVGSNAKTQTTALGELLSSKGNGASEFDAPVVSGGGVLPDARFFRTSEEVSFLRQYYLRSTDPLPNIDALSKGVMGQGNTTLHRLVANYSWEQDGFKKRELAAAFDVEAARVLRAGDKHRELAIWQNVFFKPYNFQTGTHTLCLSVSLTDCLQRGKSLQLGYGAYRLTVDAPDSILISPNDTLARQLEKYAAMQNPRGMRVLMVVELKDAANNRQLQGRLRGIHIYQRESYTDIMDVPDAKRHLIAVVLQDEIAAAPPPPVSAPSAPLSATQKNLDDTANNRMTARLFEQAKGAPALISTLTPADRKAIAALLPIKLGTDGTVIDAMEGCHQAVQPQLSVEDLQGNGTPVVVLRSGNFCTSGSGGESVSIVGRVADRWQMLFDKPANVYTVMPSRVKGWPEIGFRGRGQCVGVWQFDGRVYQHSRNIHANGTHCEP